MNVNYFAASVILTTAILAIGFTVFVVLVGPPVVARVAPRVAQIGLSLATLR